MHFGLTGSSNCPGQLVQGEVKEKLDGIPFPHIELRTPSMDEPFCRALPEGFYPNLSRSTLTPDAVIKHGILLDFMNECVSLGYTHFQTPT